MERNLVDNHTFSEKLANTERHLDVSKTHTLRAEDQIDELKKLNRSIFRPAITFNKDAKRAAQEAKVHQRYDDERREREKAMMDIRDTQNRLGQAATYGQQDDDEGIRTGGGLGSSKFGTAEQLAARKEQRKRFQFEAGASDDELEDELDDNLDEISKVTQSLKALGTAMGQELDVQNKRLDVIADKATSVDNGVFRQTQRVRSHSYLFGVLLTLVPAQEDQVVVLVEDALRKGLRGSNYSTWDSASLDQIPFCRLTILTSTYIGVVTDWSSRTRDV